MTKNKLSEKISRSLQFFKRRYLLSLWRDDFSLLFAHRENQAYYFHHENFRGVFRTHKKSAWFSVRQSFWALEPRKQKITIRARKVGVDGRQRNNPEGATNHTTRQNQEISSENRSDGIEIF